MCGWVPLPPCRPRLCSDCHPAYCKAKPACRNYKGEMDWRPRDCFVFTPELARTNNWRLRTTGMVTISASRPVLYLRFGRPKSTDLHLRGRQPLRVLWWADMVQKSGLMHGAAAESASLNLLLLRHHFQGEGAEAWAEGLTMLVFLSPSVSSASYSEILPIYDRRSLFFVCTIVISLTCVMVRTEAVYSSSSSGRRQSPRRIEDEAKAIEHKRQLKTHVHSFCFNLKISTPFFHMWGDIEKNDHKDDGDDDNSDDVTRMALTFLIEVRWSMEIIIDDGIMIMKTKEAKFVMIKEE